MISVTWLVKNEPDFPPSGVIILKNWALSIFELLTVGLKIIL